MDRERKSTERRPRVTSEKQRESRERKVKERFFHKHGLDEDSGRVYRDEKGRLRKEVWLYGRGWVSEAAFKRYLDH